MLAHGQPGIVEGKSSILLAEPRVSVRDTIEKTLRQHEFKVIPMCGTALMREAREREVGMGIIGPSLADIGNIQELGEQIRESPDWIPLLLLVSSSSEELAITALKAGISEYVRFPCNPHELTSAVRRCLQRHVRWKQGGRIVSAPGEATLMIGESRPMKEVKAYLSRAASTDSNILITGETGTGKELAAQFVHRHSFRKNKPFITVNCAAIPDNLLESELFGYEKGAFTGAQSSQDGRLKAADGGTIFLDEIGDMSAYAQAKILRAVDRKEIQRLGGAGLSVDVRIIAATNQELETLIRLEKFRKDLYFRLNVARIHLPPLRERKEDIPSIVSFYLHDFKSRFGSNVVRLTDSAWECFLAYGWPGNVRELKNLLEATLINAPSEEISPDELPPHLREKCEGVCAVMDEERKRLLSALVSTNWNKSKAADKLMWSRMTLYRKMAKYQVAGPEN
jgi:DNA-binding NtrC family response regulator